MGLNIKIKTFFLILCFLDHLQGSSTQPRLSGLTCCPQDCLSPWNSPHLFSKAPFPSQPNQQRSFYTERELIMCLSWCTQNKSFDTIEQTARCQFTPKEFTIRQSYPPQEAGMIDGKVKYFNFQFAQTAFPFKNTF